MVTEIVGVGVLPAFRRRGIAALTALRATDALDAGVQTVFCSAENDDVARLYEGIGFRRVGLACTAGGPDRHAAAASLPGYARKQSRGARGEHHEADQHAQRQLERGPEHGRGRRRGVRLDH